jgi:hypothetical protein
MAGFNMDDYVDVAQRISLFNERYPEGSLQSELEPYMHEGFLIGWFCKAFAYRTADDARPGVGHAYEAVPGKTPYTKDSEAMNAETSAWGRAIIALGFPTKKIASRQEVEARQQPASGSAGPAKRKPRPEAKKAAEASDAGDDDGALFASKEQRKELFDLKNAIGIPDARLREILKQITGQETTAGIPADLFDAVKGEVVAEGAPFQ